MRTSLTPLRAPTPQDFKDLPLLPTQLRKRFIVSDHVKVISGRHEGETGLVVHVGDNVVKVVTDTTFKDILVRPHDLQIAEQSSVGLDSLGQFELFDFVQIDAANVGVVTRIDKDMLKILDQNGAERSMKVQEVRPKRNHRGAALDPEQNAITPGITAKVERERGVAE